MILKKEFGTAVLSPACGDGRLRFSGVFGAMRNVPLNEKHTRCSIVVLTLSHGYNAVRGRRTGSNKSGAEDYLRRKTNKKTED